MRSDALNLHVDPVRTEMTSTQHIIILHVCGLGERKSKEVLAEKNLSQVWSTVEGESESVIVDESSTEERESEIVHKIIDTNEVKYAIYETENEEPSVTYNPVINDLRYFNPLEFGKNILNRLGATFKRACMETSRDRYYTEIFKTLNDYNDRNNTPLSYADIREEISKVMVE